nr:hypothetical protein [Phycicoccus sp. HDW14]
MPGQVEREVATPQHGLGGVAAATQHGTHPGQQLGGLEGLDDVVVGSAVQARDPGGGFVAGGDDDDRYSVAGPAQAPEELGAVEVGEPEVQQDDVVVVGLRADQAARGVADPVGGVRLVLQPAHEGGADHRVVLDEQDPHGRRSLGGGVTSSSPVWR